MTIGLLCLFLFACSDDEKNAATTQKPPQKLSQAQNKPEIMQYIPADTPVLVLSGSSEAPDRYAEVISKYMNSTIAYLRTMITEYAALERRAVSHEENTETTPTEKPDNQNIEKFLDKWGGDDILQKVGFTIGKSPFAIYAIDLLPVLRTQLSDDHKMNEMLADVKSQFDLTWETGNKDGFEIHYFNLDNKTLKLALALNKATNNLVVYLLPTSLQGSMESKLLGTELPAKSMMQDTSLLESIKNKYQFVNYDSFYINLEKIAHYFIYPEKHDSKTLDFLQIEDNMISQNCKTEMSSMVAKAPRLVSGLTQFDNENINTKIIWEMQPEIGSALSKIAGRIPKVDNPNAAFSFGFSIDLLEGKSVISEFIQQAIDTPYKCELFSNLNQKMNTFKAQLSQPLPPFIGNFKGAYFSLDDFKMDGADLETLSKNPQSLAKNLKMHLLLSVDQPQSLIGMAQMMVPQLQNIEIKTDGIPISLSEYIPVSGSDIPFDTKTMYAALSDTTIGFSTGSTDEGKALGQMVNSESEKLLINFSANGQKYTQIVESVYDLIDAVDLPEEIKDQINAQKEFTKDSIWWKYQKGNINFNNHGLVINADVKY